MANTPPASTSSTTTGQYPILLRDLDTPFAVITQALTCLQGHTGTLTTRQFYGHVTSLAERLPNLPYAINLCENRYLFTVALCAVLLRRQSNLLPPNKAANTLASLQQKYPCYTLHDSELNLADADILEQTLDLRSLVLDDAKPVYGVATIANQHVAAICFTSGSTGESKPIIKRWGSLYSANLHNARYMLAGINGPAYQVGTVPGQHMWGLETTVLMPLVSNLVMCDAKPFYPADIASLLASLPEPRVLVSAPIHLRALVSAGLSLPAVDRVLCATAPLPGELASTVETQLHTTIAEVYGCSEMGSMAIRHSTQTQVWTLFDAFTLSQQADGHCLAAASHIAETAQLGDFLDLIDEHHFTLRGRTDDIINIGGKRGSLAELNRILLQSEAINDGVVFLPDGERDLVRLAALVVLQPGFSKQDLVAHFRKQIDPAFIPRPILSVAALPRHDNGKITKTEINALYLQLQQQPHPR